MAAQPVSGNITVLYGGASGISEARNFRVGDGPTTVAVRDLNRDGNTDLAVANFGSNNVSVLLSACAPDVTDTAPTVTPAPPLARQQGSAGAVAAIATVADAETEAGLLLVTATTVPAGLTVTGITNTDGAVTARVAADASAAPAKTSSSRGDEGSGARRSPHGQRHGQHPARSRRLPGDDCRARGTAAARGEASRRTDDRRPAVAAPGFRRTPRVDS